MWVAKLWAVLCDKLALVSQQVANVALGLSWLLMLFVIGARFFKFGFVGAHELAIYTFMCCVLLTAGVNWKEGRHVAVTVALERFGDRVRQALTIFHHITAILWCFGLLWWSILLLNSTISHRLGFAGRDEWPLWPVHALLPIGASLLIVFILDSLLGKLRQRKVDANLRE